MMLVPRSDKRGGFTDLFIFMIVGLIVVFFSVIFIYTVGQTNQKLHEEMDDMDLGDTMGNNASEVIKNTVGEVNTSIQALKWISVLLMGGMILGIFIGSFMVQTKPVFFIPYIFMTIIAIVVSVPISNAYETVANTEMLASTFAGFTGANWIFLNLPIWISIIGIGGGIIMFSRIGKREGEYR